jgi:hypothetical protein
MLPTIVENKCWIARPDPCEYKIGTASRPLFSWENFLWPLSSFPGLAPYPNEKGEMLIK